MRGKKAKALRKQANKYVCAVMKKDIMEGYNCYDQVDNRLQMMPATDSDGYPMYDEEGVALVKPEKTPGTVTCAWVFRQVYHLLRKNNGKIRPA